MKPRLLDLFCGAEAGAKARAELALLVADTAPQYDDRLPYNRTGPQYAPQEKP